MNDAEMVQYLAKRVMGWDDSVSWEYWEPLEDLNHAWMMSKKLRDGDVHEFPLFLTMVDDGGMYYRASVHHQYDFMVISSCVDEESPCRAICKAVTKAMQVLDEKQEWPDKSTYWKMWQKPATPKVGVGVIIRDNNGRILLLKRKGAHGAGEWSLPGGHHELGETFLDTCSREAKEETNLVIDGVRKIGFTNDDFRQEGLHYVTLYFEAEWDAEGQTAENVEQDRCDGMDWFALDALPDPIWSPLKKLIGEGALSDGRTASV